MNNYPAIVFDEPSLQFRYGQRLQDPRDGLSLFGPYDADDSSHRANLSFIVIGTSEGISSFNFWSEMMNSPVTFAPRDNIRLWPPFPGFDAAFSIPWPERSVVSFSLDRDKLLEASRLRDPFQRAHEVVQYYIAALEKIQERDEKIGIGIIIVPDEVWVNCRPLSTISNAVGPKTSGREIKTRKSGQFGLFDSNQDTYLLSPDFRRQLKARAMELKDPVPLQIIRESTLRYSDQKQFGERGLTPLSDRLWNLSTALYYKAGGKPWKLTTAREGVCYIGLAFRMKDQDTACCAAQMFLDSGDGVVFLGKSGPWYSPKDKQFHLRHDVARDLLSGILKTYSDLEGQSLTEIFLHSRSSIDKEEFAGYKEACPPGVKLVGIRVKSDFSGPRLFRMGDMPVLRGSFWRLRDRAGFLWGSGFKPRIATYDGWEVPVPLRIDIQHGDAPIERVAQDIFGLTKLNYNACRLGDSEPVTVKFSDAVGEILVSNPAVKSRRPQFRFYI